MVERLCNPIRSVREYSVEDFRALLDVPGMGLALKASPIAGVAIWLLITVALWRGGFRDLVERMTRPRWSAREKLHAAAMIPVRALMLAMVAAIAAAMSLAGLLFNAAIILNLVSLIPSG